MRARHILLTLAAVLTWGPLVSAQGFQTDLAEVRFMGLQPDGSLKVDARDGTVLLDIEGIQVLAAGQTIELNGILIGTMVEVTYQYPDSKSDGNLDLATRCLVPRQCRALRLRLDYERGIWRNDITFGVEFSQERDDFSQQDLVLNYTSDTLLWESGARNWRTHLNFNLGVLTIPFAEAVVVEPPDAESAFGDRLAALGPLSGSAARQESTFDTFLASRKSVTLALGVDFPYAWRAGGDDVLNVGPFARVGLATVSLDEPADALRFQARDSVNHFLVGGVRFAQHRRVARRTNPEVLRFVELGIGYYENFFSAEELADLGLEGEGTQRFPRFVINAHLRIPGSIPVYAGVRANVGPGRDDVRLHVALKLDVDKLATLGSAEGWTPPPPVTRPRQPPPPETTRTPLCDESKQCDCWRRAPDKGWLFGCCTSWLAEKVTNATDPSECPERSDPTGCILSGEEGLSFIKDHKNLLGGEVNAVMSELTGCNVKTRCIITERPQEWHARVMMKRKKKR